MPKNQTSLQAVVGYQEALNEKQQLALSGNDFSHTRGDVRQQITRLHPKRLALRVDKIIDETPSTRTFRMTAVEGSLPPFQAGQYINLFVEIDGTHTARPYAISSSPTERDYYDITIKRAEGGFVSPFFLNRVKQGDTLTSSGPMGNFYHNPLFHGTDLVFLAGGSGIAPARSIIKNIIASEENYRLHCLFSTSFEDDIIFQNELEHLAREQDNIDLTIHITRPTENYSGNTGRFDMETLKQLPGNLQDKMFYVCGPTPFNAHCHSLLQQLGVADRRVRIEVNGPPQQAARLTGWPQHVDPDQQVTVTVKGKGQFKVASGEPLLNSLERNGYSVENACRSGECSLCRVRLLSGEVFNPPESKLRKSDREFGWIHSCMAFPVSDIEVQI